MADEIWGITAYFNPMHWRCRRENFLQFRRSLTIPLVAVELGYDGQFDLTPDDADVLLQFPASSVMWQKERLLNLALAAVPPGVTKIANLDGDVVLGRPDVWEAVSEALDQTPLLQPFSQVYYLPESHPCDFSLLEKTIKPSPGYAWLRQHGTTNMELCNPAWGNPRESPPVTYGLAWAFRREVFAERGFYDAWIVGGGTRVHCFAVDDQWQEAAAAMRFHPAMREHFRRWSHGFHRAVRGEWGYVPGPVAHLWHGEPAARKYRQRYEDFARFHFDPQVDLTFDENGAWKWNSAKPEMHQYLNEYFAGRKEDGAERN